MSIWHGPCLTPAYIGCESEGTWPVWWEYKFRKDILLQRKDFPLTIFYCFTSELCAEKKGVDKNCAECG